MKIIFFLILCYPLIAFAEVSLEDCLEDAATYANHTQAVNPLPECAGIIDSETEKSEVSSGLYRVVGKAHIIYVEKKDNNGVVVEKSLLSGDQTELVSIHKIFIDTVSRRLFVIQLKDTKNELLVFNLDFVGNVTPLNLMMSPVLFNDVISVKSSGEEKIEIINSQGSFLINADAENRPSRSQKKTLVIEPQ